MLHKRLYAVLTIIEAILILDVSEWLALKTESWWARPYYLIGDPILARHFSEYLWAMPLVLSLLTNVAGWYLLRHDDQGALRIRDKVARALILWSFNVFAARCYYQALLYDSFLDSDSMMMICLEEGLLEAVFCVLLAGLAPIAPVTGNQPRCSGSEARAGRHPSLRPLRLVTCAPPDLPASW